jgi:hypothetical protein
MAGDGFLSRWSRRKLDARSGKAMEDPAAAEAPHAEKPPAGTSPAGTSPPDTRPSDIVPSGRAMPANPAPAQPQEIVQAQPVFEPAAAPAKPPAPTIEDVRALTFESDFKRFVAPDVAPDVKNAAVKKLFADPRFNVRDMMDVYADDYSIPDPIPESMMRQLASAKFLKLFEEKDTDEGAAARDATDDVAAGNVAQSGEALQAVPHADADLRLQQDDAPAGEEPRDGVERGASAPHDPVPPRSGKLPEGDSR